MFKGTVMYAERNASVSFAADYLRGLGISVTDKPGPDISHLLLPVPSFPEGDWYLAYILSELPDHVIVSGGNLTSPLLEHYRTVDFLKDPLYLAENAAITARCAEKLISERIPNPEKLRILILGWGRIGKCLAQTLREKGAEVTVAVRKTADVAILRALGYSSEYICHISESLPRFSAIVNTVPEMVLPGIVCKSDTLLVELASKAGMTGRNILTARGLPGKMAPEESGHLIAKTFIRLSM